MPIDFACPCGKQFHVDDKLAGRQGQCPQCGKKLRIPQPAAPASPSPKSVPTTPQVVPASFVSGNGGPADIPRAVPVAPAAIASQQSIPAPIIPAQQATESVPPSSPRSSASSPSNTEIGTPRDPMGRRFANIAYGLMATLVSLIAGGFLVAGFGGRLDAQSKVWMGVGILCMFAWLVDGGRHLVGGIRGTKVTSLKDM